jgi:putative peptidoglycan lipid II flippase
MPRSLALGMGALATLGLTSFAARAGTGGISIFALAGNLEAVPLSLIGASYATAAFPVLAEHASAKRHDAFVATLSAAGRHLIFWSVVIAALSVVLRAHIVRVVLGSGAFDWNATRLTAAVLAVLVVGLVAQGIVLLASRAFYAARRSWNPLIIQVAGAAASLGSAALLLSLSARYPMLQYFVEALFRIPDVPGSAILLVAIGATIGQLFMMLLALITLGTVAPGVARGYARPLLEAAGAAILGSAAAYGVLAALGNLAPLTTLATVFTEAALAGMVGLVVAGAVLALLENKEFQDLRTALTHLRSRMLPPLSEF